MRLITDHTTLTVPATSANLGPGFDTFGTAFELRDRVMVRAVAGESRVTVRGEGAATVAAGEKHLVVRAIRLGLEYAGAPQVGLDLVSVSYTHLRAHETDSYLVCRLLLEK